MMFNLKEIISSIADVGQKLFIPNFGIDSLKFAEQIKTKAFAVLAAKQNIKSKVHHK